MATAAAPEPREETAMATGAALEQKEETAMDTEAAPELEEETGVFPDWVMLDRIGRTHCHNGLGAARKAVNGNTTAVQVGMDSGHSFYVSFTLAPHPQVGASYFDLHWPKRRGSASMAPAYPYVRAVDKDLVLFQVSIPSKTQHLDAPPDLFVYTAAGPSPSVEQLPLYTEDRRRPFLMSKFTTGILRRPDNCYIVADLILYREKEDTGNYSMHAEICVFNSKSGIWRPFMKDAPQPQDQSNGQFFSHWSTDHVLAFDGCFLCWVDYFSGVLLSDFSNMSSSPVLHFVPFPGEEVYAAEVRAERCFAQRFRSLSISQGKMRFVHIDNELHTGCQGQQPLQKITISTLNMMDGNSRFKWEPHRVINLDGLLVNPGTPRRLPEYPIISAVDPDVLRCLLRKEDFRGEASMIMVDMDRKSVLSCTPYVNQRSLDVKNHKSEFPNTPLLPTVFSKYLERPSGMPWENDKLATHLLKKLKPGM